MADIKPKPPTVDYIRRGREFGRFMAAHCTKANPHGFTKNDVAWIQKHCPGNMTRNGFRILSLCLLLELTGEGRWRLWMPRRLPEVHVQLGYLGMPSRQSPAPVKTLGHHPRHARLPIPTPGKLILQRLLMGCQECFLASPKVYRGRMNQKRISHRRGSRQRRDKEERKNRSRSTRYQEEETELEELEKNLSKRERRGKKESDKEKEKKRSQSRHGR
ncbi:hypothetical protein H9Q72_009760 [Fusarium xylarioides]|uniref:Uncharacterized protein n=1 Tax=Fusarium xylarioides TaxID=221167 RepID=A0A9P7HR53_9HYPO|nr:hypothetical protein H9Q72_009760 [Fusarium xylarioides]